MLRKLALAIAMLTLSLAVASGAAEKDRPHIGKESVAEKRPASATDIEQKKSAIMKIMAQGSYKAYIQDDAEFCSSFLEDFIKQKKIGYIKPLIEVDNYQDPRLQAYFKQCPNAKFDTTYVIYHAQTLGEIGNKEMTDEEFEEYGGIPYRGTENFKLYRVNIDNDDKNGDEYVFYAEGYYNRERKQYFYGGYLIVDLKKCKKDGGVYTRDPFDHAKHVPIDNYNGIIKYKGKYYIFDLREEIGRRLSLYEYSEKTMSRIEDICSYRKY